MSAVQQLVTELVGRGLGAAEAAGLVAQAVIEGAALASPKRSSGAERTHRWREKRASQTVTVTSQPSQTVTCDANITNEQKETPPTPPKEKTKDSPKENPLRRGQKKRGLTLCPVDWKPKPKTVNELIAEGKTSQQIGAARLEMIDWSQGGGKLKRDWDATLRNWVRRDTKPPANGRAPPASDWLTDAVAETRRKIGKRNEPTLRTAIDITPDRT